MRSRVIGTVLGVIFGVGVVLGGYLYVAGAVPAKTSAAGTVSMNLIAAQATSRTDIKSGDRCDIPRTGTLSGFLRQVVVKNESDVIIGKKTLYGSTYASIDGIPLYCVLRFSIDLPRSNFYTVFVDDQRVITWTNDELPQSSNPVVLTLSGN